MSDCTLSTCLSNRLNKQSLLEVSDRICCGQTHAHLLAHAQGPLSDMHSFDGELSVNKSHSGQPAPNRCQTIFCLLLTCVRQHVYMRQSMLIVRQLPLFCQTIMVDTCQTEISYVCQTAYALAKNKTVRQRRTKAFGDQ